MYANNDLIKTIKMMLSESYLNEKIDDKTLYNFEIQIYKIRDIDMLRISPKKYVVEVEKVLKKNKNIIDYIKENKVVNKHLNDLLNNLKIYKKGELEPLKMNNSIHNFIDSLQDYKYGD